MRLKSSWFFVLIVFIFYSCAPLSKPFNAKKDTRPNFLIIVTDDQRFDTTEYMPQTQELIFNQGVTFSNAYATTPLCGPSRSSMLTGMYAHHTEVRTNDDKLTKPTFVEDLQASGYRTGLVGKYLNTWKGEVRPEFDYWVSFFKGEVRYEDPPLNVNGKWSKQTGYITDLLGAYSVEFIQQSAQDDQPFLLIFAPNAPHEPSTPHPDDLGRYSDLEPNRPPSFNEADPSDKPSWFANRPLLEEQAIQNLDSFRRDQILTLVSLDRAIAKVVESLAATGELENTVIIFLSDNGKMWGEHRMDSKNSLYQEAVRIPFAMRYPALIPQPYTEERVIGNIDIAPTLYDLAGLTTPANIDGLSLVGLFETPASWRDGILVEGWPPRGIYAGFHTSRYLYAETLNDRPEFYDLQNDPYQLENLAESPEFQEMIAAYKKNLDEIREPLAAP